jgi:hypothetical protein
MSALDPIFDCYPGQGFQDVWFRGLDPDQVADLFSFACGTGDPEGSFPIIEHEPDDEWPTLRDVHCALKSLNVDGVDLHGIVIRIEDDALAIDFDVGLTSDLLT